MAQTVFPWKITTPASVALVLTITEYGYITKKETGPFEANNKNDVKVAVRVSDLLSCRINVRAHPLPPRQFRAAASEASAQSVAAIKA